MKSTITVSVENRMFRLVHALREVQNNCGNETFPLENNDETMWMYTNVEGFILPKFATADDIKRIIRDVQDVIVGKNINDVQDVITENTQESWCQNSWELEEKGFTDDFDEAEAMDADQDYIYEVI